MAGILYGCLKKDELPSRELEDIRKALRDEYIRLQSLRKIREDEAATVLEALAELEIVPVLLKGLYLQEYIYGKEQVRPSSDIDILIDNDGDFELAVSAVAKLGYSKYVYYSEAWEHMFMKSTTLLPDSIRIYFQVDLHRSLVYSRNDRRKKFDTVLMTPENYKTKQYKGKPVRILTPEASFLYLAFHALEVHYDCRTLVWLTDLIGLTKSEGFDEGKLKALARKADCSDLVEYALYLIGRVVNGPATGINFEVMKEKGDFSFREKLRNIDGLLNKACWLFLWLFPSSEYLADHYGPDGGSLGRRLKYLAEKTGMRGSRRGI